MKHLILILSLVSILNISSLASDLPKQVLAKLEIKQVSISILQSNYKISDSLIQNTNNYSHYEGEYFRAQKRRNGGIFLTAFGLGGFIAGSLVAIENQNDAERENLGGVGTGIFITAAVMTGIGIPLWVSGSSKMKKNKTILEKMEEKPISLQLSSSNNGIGISLRF